MCSASSRITRSRMSRLTSTSSRSAPLPPRSTRIACSWSSAWVTEAPLSMAILVAVVSWPFNVPTMRSRMSISCSSVRAGHARSVERALAAFRLDDFRHGYAELVFDQDHLAARDQAVVDVDVDRLADAAIEFEHGARPELQQLADVHLGAAEHGRDLHRHVEHRLEVGGDARCLFVLVIGDVGIGGRAASYRDELIRTTRCGVDTSCEKQSLTRPVISPSGSAAISWLHNLRATATATSTASVSIRRSIPEKRATMACIARRISSSAS